MKRRRNNDERRQWIDNDEGLYRWQRSSGQSMRAFIRQNRTEIDSHIDGELNRPAATTTWQDVCQRPMY
jgi:hypothetical protein